MKKQSFAINQKDKGLLTFLIAVAIVLCCYYFIIGPQLNKTVALNVQKETVVADLDRAAMIVERLPALEKEEKEMKAELVEKYRPFFYELNQERILYKLDDLMIESGFQVISYVTSDDSVSGIAIPKGTYTPPNYPLLNLASVINMESLKNQESLGDGALKNNTGSSAGESASDAVPTNDITLSFNSSSYSSLISFMEKIEKMNKTVILKNMVLNQSSGELGGQLVLSFYSMPKLDESEKDYLKFLPGADLGRENPFQ